MNPTLSIGIPVYNQAGTIRQTVESALNQEVPFAEVVVCDNHSTDGTARVLADFGDRIRVVCPSRHLRMTENWNFCVSEMRSGWFALLSGDDLVHTDFAAKVGRAIRRYPTAGLVRTDWQLIDENGTFLRTHRQWSVRRFTKRPQTWQEQLFGPKVNFAAFAARVDLWRKVGGYPAEYHLIQDWMFALRMAEQADFVRVPRALASYRVLARPILESQRLGLYIEDDWRYVTKVLASLPVNSATKARVADARLGGLIRKICETEGALVDGPLQEKLAEIARCAGLSAPFDAWLSDPSKFAERPPTLADRLKAGIRSRILRRA